MYTFSGGIKQLAHATRFYHFAVVEPKNKSFFKKTPKLKQGSGNSLPRESWYNTSHNTAKSHGVRVSQAGGLMCCKTHPEDGSGARG